MTAAAAQTQAPRFGDAPPTQSKRYPPVPHERMKELGQDIGYMMSIVLEGNQTIEEGAQDVERWRHIGPRLTMYQWLRISNDTGSMIRFMEVERVHGAPGQGLRALSLRDLWPPVLKDMAEEPIASTGDWYVRHGGTHRKWMVIQPNGNVRHEGLNTEAEAKIICHRESGNPRPIGS
jgi:hypothetical protein